MLAAAIILRFSTLGLQSYWSDEAATVGLVKRSLGSMLLAIPNKERTPPVYYVTAWFWSRLFGTSEVGLRSLSAVFGCLTVLCAYLIAKRVAGVRAGLLAAALVTASPLLVWYSQEARSYAMLACLCAASVWLWLEAMGAGSKRPIMLWGVVACAAIATHYFASFLVMVEAAALVRRYRLRSMGVVSVFLICVQAALIPLALHQARAQQSGDYITATSLPSRVVAVPMRFLLGEHGAPGAKDLFAAALIVFVSAAAWLWARRAEPAAQNRSLSILTIAVIGVALPLILAVAGLDFFAYRNLLGVGVLFAVVGAVGLSTQGSRIALPTTIGLVGVFMVLTIAVDLDPGLQRADWRFAPTALARSPARRLIVVTPYYDEGVFRIYVPATQLITGGRVRVSEIDLVGYRLARSQVPPRFDRRFRVASIVDHQKLSFVRYAARRSVLVHALRVPGLQPGTRAFIVQRPS